MLLTTILDQYLLRNRVSAGHEVNHRISLATFERWLTRPATINDLNDDTLSRYVQAMERRYKSLWTVRTKRNTLLAVWRFANRQGLTSSEPRYVRSVPRPASDPQAWTVDEVRKLLDAADAMPGMFRTFRMPQRLYWRAFLMVAYDTGLRIGDVLQLTPRDVRHETAIVVQHKTGKSVCVRFGQDTLAAVGATFPPARDTVFGWVHRRVVHTQFTRLVQQAGITGTSRFMRRTSGTLIEMLRPGAGHLHLGNGADVFRHHYLDRRMFAVDLPLPPRL